MSVPYLFGTEETSRRAPSPGEVETILERHGLWLRSKGQAGQVAVLGNLDLSGVKLRCAVLSHADLSGLYAPRAELTAARLDGADLRGANLSDAKLRHADLHEADCSEADFRGANLQGTNLGYVTFRGANLRRSRLRDAILTDANLLEAHGLLAGQLGGTSLAGAQLPAEIGKFDSLGNVTDSSKSTQNLFTTIILVCAYTWLTIASTTDAQLLNNDAPASSRLPILGIDIPLVRFYTAVPILLMCIYVYFHLMLQRLWEELSELPAVFPDGRSLDQKAYPWLLNAIVRDHAPRLREGRSNLAKWQARMSSMLAWGIVPLTMFMAWARFLRSHDWWITSLHIGTLSVAVGSGIAFLRLASSTLRGAEHKRGTGMRAWRSARAICLGVAGSTALVLGFLSLGVIEGINADSVYDEATADRIAAEYSVLDIRRWFPELLHHLEISSSASLCEASLSTKPANWSPNNPALLDTVHGADLEHRRKSRNLRHAMAFNVFAVNAYLQDSDLRWSDFREADMRRADFRHGWLQGANFRFAEVNEADFRQANLTQARFRQAIVDKARFEESILRDANFTDASLHGANFSHAVLVAADLTRANLSPMGPDGELLLEASGHYKPTVLSGADLTRANLSHADLRLVEFQPAPLDPDKPEEPRATCLRQARLIGANLKGANLAQVNLSDADLSYAQLEAVELTGANLKGANLTGATGLTQKQIATAVTDARTRLPSGFQVVVIASAAQP